MAGLSNCRYVSGCAIFELFWRKLPEVSSRIQKNSRFLETCLGEPSWPGLPCGLIFFVPEAKEARSIPSGAGDREGDLRQTVIGLAVPGKAVGHDHHPLRPSIPLPDENRAGSKLGPLLVEAGQSGGHCRSVFLRNRLIQHLPSCVIEIAEAIGLDPIGDDRKQ